MIVTLLLDDYFDAEELNPYFDTWDMIMIDRTYSATETVVTVDMGSSQFTADELAADLEDEYLVGVKVLDVEY